MSDKCAACGGEGEIVMLAQTHEYEYVYNSFLRRWQAERRMVPVPVKVPCTRCEPKEAADA